MREQRGAPWMGAVIWSSIPGGFVDAAVKLLKPVIVAEVRRDGGGSRQEPAGFINVQELLEVSGIGERDPGALEPLVTVGS